MGRQIQPPLPERREDAGREARQRHHRPAARAAHRIIENAWIANPEVRAGDEVPVKVFLRPYRGERLERDFNIKIPAGLPKGDHRILLSDADTLNRMQSMAAYMNRFMDLPQTVSLINQERSNNKLYVSAAAQPDRLLRRQDAAQPAGLRAERDAGRPRLQPRCHLAGDRLRTDGDAVRLRDQRQLRAENHRKITVLHAL